MKIDLVSVGKPRERETALLHDRYAERIRRFGLTYDAPWVADVRAGGRFSEAHARGREAAALLARWDGRGTLVALDRKGRDLTSRTLAGRLESWATPALTLTIGGPNGLGDEVLEAAHERWSLSSLTLPHELVRVVVAEQLYRALTILRGVPYHK